MIFSKPCCPLTVAFEEMNTYSWKGFVSSLSSGFSERSSEIAFTKSFWNRYCLIYPLDRATVSVSKIAPLWENFPYIPVVVPCYFKNLQKQRDMIAFTKAQLNLMLSAVLRKVQKYPIFWTYLFLWFKLSWRPHTCDYILIVVCSEKTLLGTNFGERCGEVQPFICNLFTGWTG